MNRRNGWYSWFLTLAVVWTLGFGTGASLIYALFLSRSPAPTAADTPDTSLVNTATEKTAISAATSPDSTQSALDTAAASGNQIQAALRVWPARHLFIAINGQWLSQRTRELLAAIKPGGVVLREANLSSPSQTLALIREIKDAVGIGEQQFTDLPLIAVSQEGGALNLLGLPDAPSAVELGNERDVERARRAGRAFAEACMDRGINVLLAPVLDIYEPGAVLTGLESRSFGTENDLVTVLGLAFADGVIQGGVIPVIKHFPGYGAATRGAHGGPVIHKDMTGIALTAYPFSEAVRAGIPGVLVGHIAVPLLDDKDPTRPASVSPLLVQALLREKWGHEGVVLADDVASDPFMTTYGIERAVVNALAAGCDAVLFLDPDEGRIRAICTAIEDAVTSGNLPIERLEESKARLAAWQTWLKSPVPLKGPLPELPPRTLVAQNAQTQPPAAPVLQDSPPDSSAQSRSEPLVEETPFLPVVFEPLTENKPISDPDTAPATDPSAPSTNPVPSSPEPAAADTIAEAPSAQELLSREEQTLTIESSPTAVTVSPNTESLFSAPKPETNQATSTGPQPVPEVATAATGPPPPEQTTTLPTVQQVETTPNPPQDDTETKPATIEDVLSGILAARNEQPAEPIEAAIGPAPSDSVNASDPEVVIHTVVPGETLTSISERYVVDVRDLMYWNTLTDSRILAGQQLRIHLGPNAPSHEDQPKPATTEYRVRRGDTISKIARQFGTTPKAILDLNPIPDPDHLIVGQRLKVPL